MDPGHDWPTVINNDITLEDNFRTQLCTIAQDFQNDFKNIKHVQNRDGSKGSIKKYYSLIHVDGAYESFIEEDTLKGRFVFEARYFGSTIASYAEEPYEVLKANVDFVGLSGCTLLAGKETINGSTRSQLYTAYRVNGQSTPVLLDMVVEIAIVQRHNVTVGEESIVWEPVIKVYGR
jgi:hypothetical protein